VLLGGHPFRVLKLSPTGATTVRRWFAAAADPANSDDPGDELTSERAEVLAMRLLEAGMVHPEPSPSTTPCHVVIPFRGRMSELATTLAGVRAQRPNSITVVDDGNTEPVQIDDVTVVRHARQRGPAAARNTGWRHVVSTGSLDPDDVVLFVDAGVVIEDGVLAVLAGHLSDPSVGAAGPRVTTVPGRSAIERYETLHSPLDLGTDPSPVGPGRPVTYVPTACLAVRASLVSTLGGFDESLRFGEDVDFVWRSSEVATVRYDPSLEVHHPARPTLATFVQQRLQYASAAASLTARHGDVTQTWQTSVLGLTGVALTWMGRPAVGFAVGLLPLRVLTERLSATATPLPTSVRLLSLGQSWALRSFAENMARSWVVPAALLAVRSPVARATRWWMLAGWSRRLTTSTDPAVLALGVVDDVAYGCGIALGAWRQRSVRVLWPTIRRW
jgi:mycofactocin system glycosyltransferase